MDKEDHLDLHVVLNSVWCPSRAVVLSCMMHVRTVLLTGPHTECSASCHDGFVTGAATLALRFKSQLSICDLKHGEWISTQQSLNGLVSANPAVHRRCHHNAPDTGTAAR